MLQSMGSQRVRHDGAIELSDKLNEDQNAGERHRARWVDLNSEIKEVFPEEVTFKHGPAGSLGESCVYLMKRGFQAKAGSKVKARRQEGAGRRPGVELVRRGG